MSLQDTAVLTQHQPWQQSAGVEHRGRPDQTPKDNKSNASTAERPAEEHISAIQEHLQQLSG